MRVPPASLIAATTILLIASSGALGQSVRDHTRLGPGQSTPVTESQATELTLTLTQVAIRPIQTWVRTAGVIDHPGGTVSASVSTAEGRLVKVGQRVRAFSPEARSSMFQAKVTRVAPQGARVGVGVTLSGPTPQGSTRYVLEIVTEHGDFLSVPNEAIMETAGEHRVYVQRQQGQYRPKKVQLGVQGELYTQVLEGLTAGEQVVTFGSFFIDADYKLKGF